MTASTYASVVKDHSSHSNNPYDLLHSRAVTFRHNLNKKRNIKYTRKDPNKKARTDELQDHSDESKLAEPVTQKAKNQEAQTSNSSIDLSRSKPDSEKRGPISQDDHLQRQIGQVHEEQSKGEFKLLDSVSSSNGSTLQRSSDELEEANNSNVTNKGVVQPITNSDDNKPNPQTANVVNSTESNVAKTSMGNDHSSPEPVHSRFRKKNKQRTSKSRKSDDNPKVQDGINRNDKVNCKEITSTGHPDVEKKLDLNIDKPTNISRQQQDNPTKNSKRCKCLASPKLLNDLDNETCYCDAEVSKDFDFDKHIREVEIPDNRPPIPATKNKQNKIEYVSDGDDNLSDQAKSDRKLSNNSKHQKTAAESSLFFRHIPHLPHLPNLLKLPKRAYDYLLDQFDPLPPKESTSTSNSHSNSYTCGNSYSTNYESYGRSSISNRANSYRNYYNNNNKQDNIDQCNSLLTTSSTQHMDSQFLQRSIHLLVLVIAFDHCYFETPNIGTCHSRGFHPIVRIFRSFREDDDNAFGFINDSIMNCWANSWKVALVVSNNPRCGISELRPFFKKIRESFESDILDIILIWPAGYYYNSLNSLDVSIAKDSYNESWDQVFYNLIQNVISKAYRRNKYGKDDILFYNKDEPYYEFTNFYRATIEIDNVDWPTTEHYFQAAKFRDPIIRHRICCAYSAREAFTIARNNDYRKRKDWESPTPPDGTIFKEGIMKDALWEKFTQHVTLKNKLLSTGKVNIYEHTENDRYWGDGGTNRDGLNKLGIMLKEIRDVLMEDVKSNLIRKYRSYRTGKWIVPELKELQQFEDLIEF